MITITENALIRIFGRDSKAIIIKKNIYPLLRKNRQYLSILPAFLGFSYSSESYNLTIKEERL